MEIEGVGSLRNIGAVFWKFHEAMIDDRSNEYILPDLIAAGEERSDR